jgi:hypothetical protein
MSENSSPDTARGDLTWYKALSPDGLPEGRVEAVSCGDTTVAGTHHDGEYAALDNSCPTSDGGFGQYMGEFTTAVKYDMDVTHVLLNDDELGKISKEQRTGGREVWQTHLANPNVAEFTQNCGCHGVFVDGASDFDEALDGAIAYEGPALVEVLTDSDPV